MPLFEHVREHEEKAEKKKPESLILNIEKMMSSHKGERRAKWITFILSAAERGELQNQFRFADGMFGFQFRVSFDGIFKVCFWAFFRVLLCAELSFWFLKKQIKSRTYLTYLSLQTNFKIRSFHRNILVEVFHRNISQYSQSLRIIYKKIIEKLLPKKLKSMFNDPHNVHLNSSDCFKRNRKYSIHIKNSNYHIK